MEDLIQKARNTFKINKDYWSDNYNKSREDQNFLSDDQFAQWSQTDYQNRVASGRPALTIDQLSQFVHQVANDMRMNTPSIKVIPSGNNSSVETADAISGIIKNIEYVSGADDVYDYAGLCAVRSAIGFIRVDHDYEDENSFNQHILIQRVVNPLMCYIDASSVAVDGSDAKNGTIIEPMKISEFERLYPKKEPSSFDDDNSHNSLTDNEFINIAEHFEKVEEEIEIGMRADGTVEQVQEGIEYQSTRKTKRYVIKRYKMSGTDILEEGIFPGKYIPIIPVYGEEFWVDGRRHLLSLIRRAKDSQRMFNYWKSLETELLMKQPIAPIMAAEGQVEDYSADWKNPSKAMVLRYKTTDASGNPVGAPQRLEPPVMPTGIVNAARGTIDDMKGTMGMYNASIGQRSNETSGVAIAQRQQEGDVATFHFADNLNKSIAHVGRVIVSMIPEIYDTQRILRMIDEEENSKEVGVNGLMLPDQKENIDLINGKYDVKVITGAPFTTRRQEAAEFFQQIFTRSPELLNVMGDLMFKNMDFAGAQAMAKRMEKVIDPKFLDETEENPAVMQLQQVNQQLQAQLQQAVAELNSKQADLQLKAQDSQLKAQSEQMRAELEASKLQLQQSENMTTAQLKEAELVMKQKEIELKAMELELERQKMQQEMEMQKLQAEKEIMLAKMEVKKTLPMEVLQNDTEISDGVPVIAQMMATITNLINQNMAQLDANQKETAMSILQALNKPKKIIRNKQGLIERVE